MQPTAMLDDILHQPESLLRACKYQFADGAGSLDACARTLRGSRRITFTGMGSSLFAAIPAAYYLESQGIAAEVVEASELLHFGTRSLRPDGAFVLISRSGESIETVKLLPYIRESGARWAGVTNVPGSTLARECADLILLNSHADRMVAVQTYTTSVAVLMLLAAEIAGQPLETWREFIEATADLTATEVQRAIAASDGWVEFLKAAPVVHLMGRGPSLASAHECALLFNEAARVPAVAISPAAFRHGPVEIVNERMRAIVFASQSQTRELDRALAADLHALGAQTRICDGSEARPLETIIEIVPVQVGVCALATSMGIDPGDFRFATLVTAAESGFNAKS